MQKGILIEPVPSFYREILTKNRKAYVLNACLAKKRPLVSKFRVHTVLSGRAAEMNPAHNNRIDKESGTKERKTAYFPCFSLTTIMLALNVTHIDYFSLDVEGGELDVLRGIDFERLHIDTFSIEHNGFEATKNEIIRFMAEKKYRLDKINNQDGYFSKI